MTCSTPVIGTGGAGCIDLAEPGLKTYSHLVYVFILVPHLFSKAVRTRRVNIFYPLINTDVRTVDGFLYLCCKEKAGNMLNRQTMTSQFCLLLCIFVGNQKEPFSQILANSILHWVLHIAEIGFTWLMKLLQQQQKSKYSSRTQYDT